VRVPEFSLDGGGRRGLRQTLDRMRREGASFELLSPLQVPALLPELAAVSSVWLENKGGREKRFSLGCFDRAYLSKTPVALVRRHGSIVAFANLWAPEAREECSLDLMRYDDAAPAGVMEYLCTELLLWAKRQGYGRFNLGMAPLSGWRTTGSRRSGIASER
jgi:phosphatidylglycerol lysyltransferase